MPLRNRFVVHPLTLALAIFSTLLFSLSGIAIAYLLGSLLDGTTAIAVLLGLLAAALLVQAVTRYARNLLFNRYAVGVQSHLRRRVGEALCRMPASDIESQRTGDMLTRASAEVESVFDFFDGEFSDMVEGLISLLAGVAYLLWLRWELAAFVLAGSAVIIAVTLLLNRRIAVAHRAWRATQGEMSVVAQDIAAGQLDIKAMGIERGVMARFDESLRRWEKAFYHRNAVRAGNRATSMLFAVIVFIGIPAISSGMVIRGTFTVGMVLAAIQAAQMIAQPLQSVEFMASTITGVRINFQRVRELIDLPAERGDGKDLPGEAKAPLVEFKDVRFSYGGGDILKSLDLTVRKGQTVALVGASGSGKSTALRLVAGLYDAAGGTVRFAGHALGEWSLPALRRHMAYVPQESYLFPGTLKENLKCGADIPDAELRAVVERVRLSDWLDRQPEGWDMQVGERGSHLSGGLNQRVSIARALLRKPDLLLLDEPTSALDEATEREVMETLREAAGDAACLIVAHRLSSIAYADHILAMRDGAVVEEGSHAELMEKRGYYHSLYVMQGREAGA